MRFLHPLLHSPLHLVSGEKINELRAPVVKTDTIFESVCVKRKAITRVIARGAFMVYGIMSFRLETNTHCRFQIIIPHGTSDIII